MQLTFAHGHPYANAHGSATVDQYADSHTNAYLYCNASPYPPAGDPNRGALPHANARSDVGILAQYDRSARYRSR